LDEVIDVKIKDKMIEGCIITIEEQLKKLNLGSEMDPKEVFITNILPTFF
jgi:copper chaperone CopZ